MDKTKCPRCGSRVLPLAAGCSLCGADLDTTRFDRGPSPLQQIGSWFSAISYGPRLSGSAVVLVLVVGYLLLRFL
jgi:predicted amidophosphoribosyltransferase